MRLGFIGNFVPPHSTENDRRWSFESLGHTVIPFQENETSADQLLAAMGDLDLLLYSHTHDPAYVIAGLKDVFAEYKRQGVPTASAHLDRWAWLKRVQDVGREATWFTEHIFMADASPEAVELYDKFGLNWHYLRAGVVERDCYMAVPDHVRFPHEIVFVGSKGYHPEYPFREKLVDWLESTYGDRFCHYGNGSKYGTIRGHDLNVLYASAKIVVGDTCFGGRPKYVSDRYYDVRGRGGFLLHPEVDGVDDVGVIHYDHDDLEDLKHQIDVWLAADESREVVRREGFDHVRRYETYTNRAKEMLEVIFDGKA